MSRQFPPVHLETGPLAGQGWPMGPGYNPNPNRPPLGDGPNLGQQTPPQQLQGYVQTYDAHRYASLIESSIIVTALPQKFLNAPSGRRNMLLLTNVFRGPPNGCNYIIGWGTPPTIGSATLTIPDGIMIGFDDVIPQNDLWVMLDNPANTGGTLAFAYSTIVV